ncbi:MAG TPA: PAS domain-containing protein [Ktedonobacterales bacterium]
MALENARLYRAAETQAQELDAIFDSISDAVLLVDGEGRVVRENRAASALRTEGAADLAAVEQTIRAEAAGAVAAAEDKRNESNGAGGASKPHTEVALTDGAGEERQYAVTAAPLREEAQVQAGQVPRPGVPTEGGAGAVVVWHDLTEARRLLRERQARAEAIARRALLQRVIDELPGGIYLVHGPQARLVLANQAARAVWGDDWPAGQPMVAFLAERGVRILSPEGQPLTEEELATIRAARSGEAVRHHQEIIRRPDGTALPVLLNAVALDPGVFPFAHADNTENHPQRQANGGKPYEDVQEQDRAALVVLQDVTALKEAERVKDEFITIAAHELKTPMAAVKGYTDMLRRRSGIGSGSRSGGSGGGEPR